MKFFLHVSIVIIAFFATTVCGFNTAHFLLSGDVTDYKVFAYDNGYIYKVEVDFLLDNNEKITLPFSRIGKNTHDFNMIMKAKKSKTKSVFRFYYNYNERGLYDFQGIDFSLSENPFTYQDTQTYQAFHFDAIEDSIKSHVNNAMLNFIND